METPPVLPRINDYVTHWAESCPSREAFVSGDRRITYEKLADDVDRWAKALLHAEVSPGDRVALLGNPCPEAITLFLAAASIGGVFQGLNPKHRAPELAFQLDNAKPVLLLNTVTATLGVPNMITDINAFIANGRTVSDSILAEARTRVTTFDPAALVYTSGSTGRPKGALLPHRGFTWPSAIQADYWFDGPGSIVCNLPIDHVGALGNICATALVTGSTIVFQERFDAAGVLGLIEKERVTYWGAAPTMFLLSVNTLEWRTADLSSLHKIIWSGGAAPIALIRALASRCSNLVTSYGMTETVGEVTFSDPADDLETLSVTIGRPEPRYEVQIVREDGSLCDVDEEGEIVVRGNFIMRGYLNEAEATAATIDPSGWLHTGDVARRRSDGCFVLVGRKTEMFKSGGYNVYPREVELALEGHPAVRQAGVVAVKDDMWGSVGHAFVLADPSEVDVEELDTFVRERLANYKVPKRFTITPDLPMLPIGKLDKKALKATADA